MQPIRKLLVANRGEIALRIIRSAHEMGIETVAVYSDADRESAGAKTATEAYALGGNDLAQTYLNGEKIIEIAQKAGADAIAPGYGFLAEDAKFAAAVADAGIIWVGPKAQAIADLGDKIQARQLAERCQVQTIPGISAALDKGDESKNQVLDFARAHGYPILIKKADAGGGRGITRLNDDTEVEKFFTDHTGDPAMALCFVEKLLEHSRHVETQCLRDSHGNFTVISTRDCSVQRRNQKVIEEAPAPFLTQAQNQTLLEYSARLFHEVDYQGAGTCEFLVGPDGNIYFLEVNPRLQVEHTISEEVTGIDLVEACLRVASGEEIPRDFIVSGHAIELRINADDPADGLKPVTGKVTSIEWPGGLGVRIDTYLRSGDTISGHYDSMIAKVIVKARTRAGAIAKARRALSETKIAPLPTNLPLLDTILSHPDFQGGEDGSPFAVYTKWLEEKDIIGQVEETEKAKKKASASGNGKASGSGKEFVIEVDGKRGTLFLPADFFSQLGAGASPEGQVVRGRQPLRGKRTGAQAAGAGDGSVVVAAAAAAVTRVAATVGQAVNPGDLLLVLEAMKMEEMIYATAAGTVKEVLVKAGDAVSGGQKLVEIELAETGAEASLGTGNETGAEASVENGKEA